MSKYILLLLFAVVTFGCDDIIEVEDISNTTVIVLAPTNNAVLNNTTLTFSWEPIESAETYQIQIATPTFDEALQIVVDSTLANTNYTTTLENTNYEWRVRAKNSGYQTQYSTNSFSIEE